MRCAEIKEVLPAYADDPEATLAVRRHLSRCTDCKAELASYDSLLDGLASMRDVAVEPPPGLARSLAEMPAAAGRVEKLRTHVVRNRRAYVSGAAVALVGATGAVLWRNRRAQPLPA